MWERVYSFFTVAIQMNLAIMNHGMTGFPYVSTFIDMCIHTHMYVHLLMYYNTENIKEQHQEEAE